MSSPPATRSAGAVIGSRRAAWRAGQTPKITPTASENPTASRTVVRLMLSPQPASDPTSAEMATPNAMPSRPPGHGEHEGLDQELGHDVAPPRPDRLADPDLPRPLAYRDQHDVHDPDAAHEQADRRDAGQEQGQEAGDRPERGQQLCLVHDREVVLGPCGDPVPGAQQLRDLELDQGDLVRVVGGDGERLDGVARDEVVAHGRQRDQDLVVEDRPWAGGSRSPGTGRRRH